MAGARERGRDEAGRGDHDVPRGGALPTEPASHEGDKQLTLPRVQEHGDGDTPSWSSVSQGHGHARPARRGVRRTHSHAGRICDTLLGPERDRTRSVTSATIGGEIVSTNATSQSAKSVAIVGGGIAGLCAGIYAQMNGYRSHIYEMHSLPGGLMTAWERKGYTIDYCIHWLVGSSPSSSMHKLWREVGLLRDTQTVDLEIWYQYEDADGNVVTFWRDVDRLEAHLCELSPADTELIKRMLADVRRLSRADMPVAASARVDAPARHTEGGSKHGPLAPARAPLGQAHDGRPRSAVPVAASA